MTPQVDSVFRALGDPTRLAIVERLAQSEARVTDLARPFPMSLNAISKHVKILEDGGLVKRRVDGRTHVISLAPGSLREARDWMERQEKFWTERLDYLRTFMASTSETE